MESQRMNDLILACILRTREKKHPRLVLSKARNKGTLPGRSRGGEQLASSETAGVATPVPAPLTSPAL